MDHFKPPLRISETCFTELQIIGQLKTMACSTDLHICRMVCTPHLSTSSIIHCFLTLALSQCDLASLLSRKVSLFGNIILLKQKKRYRAMPTEDTNICCTTVLKQECDDDDGIF